MLEERFVGVALLGAAGIILLQTLRARQASGAGGFFPYAPPSGGGGAGGTFGQTLAPSLLEFGNIVPREVSASGQAFIKRLEGLTLTIKNDAGHPEIGYGHDLKAGENFGSPISVAQANAIFAQDMGEDADVINSSVTVPLNQNQFDALASFALNVGYGTKSPPTGFRGSQLLELLNAGNYAGAAAQFSRWIHSQGVVSGDLVQRRAAERSLFLSGAAA
jgi:lysozyme